MRSSITIYAAALAALLVASTLAQGPGDGVAKATYASSDPTTGLAWMLKYLPTTAAEVPAAARAASTAVGVHDERLSAAAIFSPAPTITAGCFPGRSCCVSLDTSAEQETSTHSALTQQLLHRGT